MFDPDELFMDNGGRELLSALDIEGEGLAALFSTARPTWKEGSRGSRPSTTVNQAVLICGGGQLSLYSAVKAPGGLPENVRLFPPALGDTYRKVLQQALDGPRPLLVLVTGASYGKHLAAARVSLDPEMVVVSGVREGAIDRARLNSIRSATQYLGIAVADLSKLAWLHQQAVRGKPGLWTAETTTRSLLKLAGLDRKSSPEKLESFARKVWETVDGLPLLDDPAWDVVRADIVPARAEAA